MILKCQENTRRLLVRRSITDIPIWITRTPFLLPLNEPCLIKSARNWWQIYNRRFVLPIYGLVDRCVISAYRDYS